MNKPRLSRVSVTQDKKGIAGKAVPAERRALYQRHIRPSTMLAKSILEGKRPGRTGNTVELPFVLFRCFTLFSSVFLTCSFTAADSLTFVSSLVSVFSMKR